MKAEHLGVGASIEDLATSFHLAAGLPRSEVRVLEVTWRPLAWQTKEGCPSARQIVCRTSDREKLLLVVSRCTVGHF